MTKVALLLLVAACETEYAYVPVTNATVIAGRVAADYPVPRDAPEGDVRIASYGIVELGSATDETDRVRALHLRMTLIDEGARPWAMDTREQRIELDGWGSSAAAFASANAGSRPPLIDVPPSGHRVVDLFFPLPIMLQKEAQLPGFDVTWRVQTSTQTIVEQTSFERIIIEPPPDYASADYGAEYYWGPPYWYDPSYPGISFTGGVGIPARYVSQPLYVHRTSHPPRFKRRHAS